ncbi:MAG: cyclic nucleotide-binding domain-containing protein [Rhodospirillales bacterium]|nr:cyclic nucleotide-binding domain-containing protein [Rhodospirillales bacterium]
MTDKGAATIECRAGDVLFEQGQPGDRAYMVRDGLLEVSQIVNGDKQVLGAVGPGEIVGEMALIDDQPRMATVTALDDSVLLAIDRVSFRARLDATDKTTRHLLNRFIHLIRAMAARLAESRAQPR